MPIQTSSTFAKSERCEESRSCRDVVGHLYSEKALLFRSFVIGGCRRKNAFYYPTSSRQSSFEESSILTRRRVLRGGHTSLSTFFVSSLEFVRIGFCFIGMYIGSTGIRYS